MIAFFALRFPKSRLSLAYLVFFKPFYLRLSAIWMFAIRVAMQCFIAFQQVQGIRHVSGGAHLGGLPRLAQLENGGF